MKNRFTFNQLITLIGLLILSPIIFSNPESEYLFNLGSSYHQQKKYDLAIEPLENAVKLEPENAAYHRLLAVNYGRAAEEANWFRAMSLAQKTLEHLEIAADLDKNNVEILDDLMDYYREAPVFLGGNKKKADEIEALIEKLSQTQSHSSN